MLPLKDYEPQVIELLNSGLSRFASEHSDVEATSIALYASPQNGWISLCLNTRDTGEVHADNCPDFTFVEFALLEVPKWQEEYESEEPEIKPTKGRTLSIDVEEEGDDAFNKPLFDFLVGVVQQYFKAGGAPLRPFWAGVQMLDSAHVSFWKL